ncbi:hypothetical protein G5C66_14820 [Nocardioides sp. KC13]|uniref:Uncharacterized protein n=1 Tax=Nocardioides turkmenicus TaxID=2711220 RepID=A0A6M1R5P5_9ACTN|nr:hypothetical protein [Nocardioides sp. KC13]NGN94011.1 hypothetical protein [Nocardioides sp. KC13]
MAMHVQSSASATTASTAGAGALVLPNTGSPLTLPLVAAAVALLLLGITLIDRGSAGGTGRVTGLAVATLAASAITWQLLALDAFPSDWELVGVAVALFTTAYLALAVYALLPVRKARR